MTATPSRSARMLRAAARHPWLVVALLAAVVAAGFAGRTTMLDSRRAVAVPLPVYEIESVSGSHHASLLNLPLPALGVAAVPIPVDVNGDLLPDVTVALNLIDVAGLFNNPPDLGAVLAPNLAIDRLLPGIPLAPVNAPLRINAKLTVVDVLGTEEPTTVRLGYDTGEGGSIPSRWKLVASGLTGFFNPVVASVDAPGYEGPLTLVAGIEQGDERTDADLRFAPLPSGLQISYGSDGAGQHLGVAHGGAVGATPADREVDLDAAIAAVDGDDVSTIDARVDRLPGSIAVTIRPGSEGNGGFDYVANADGRLPDLRVDVAGDGPGDEPLLARLDLEALPPELHAEWSLPEDGPVHVRFESPVRPLGGVDARVANFAGDPVELAPYIPGEEQFVDFRQAGEGGERLVVARIEGIVLADLTEAERGLAAQFTTAGGGLPLELHASLAEVGDAERILEATSTITPLPADMTVAISDAGDDERTDPLAISYTSSDSIDVDGVVEVRDPEAAGATCGEPGTLCASLAVRDIPTSIDTRIGSFTNDDGVAESRIAVDAIPRPGATAPDVLADVTFGQSDGVPLIASAELLGIPDHMRVRAVEGADQTTARAEFHACDRDFDAGTCAEDSEGEVGALAFSLRNFDDRPEAFPVQIAETPNYALVTARGRQGDPDTVDFEAEGRVVSIRELLYVNEDVFGLRTRIGGEEALSALVDLDGVDLGGDGLTTLLGEVLVPSVPAVLDVCFRASSDPVVGVTDAVTAPCQDTDPFGDGEPVDGSPLSVAYRASREIDIRTEVAFTDHGPSAGVADDFQLDALLDITDLPSEATAHVLVPDDEGPVRAVYDTGEGSGANPTTVHFEAAALDAGLVCRDPRPPAPGDKAVCAEGTIVGLPTRADVRFDPDVDADNISVTTEGLISIEDFGLSIVEGELDGEGEPTHSALVVTGRIIGLPETLTGTLHVPSDEETAAGEALAVSFEASPPIEVVEASVQNFVGADPLPAEPPAQRADLPAVTPDTYDTVTLLQQGDRLRVVARITQLERAGYRSYVTGREEDPEPDDPEVEGALVTTHVVDLGFGDDRNVRAYVDADDGTERVIADVTLLDRPAGMSLCFRGARATTTTVTEPTFCDESPATDAAFELVGEPHAPSEALDVHAFFRIADTLTGEILSGRADVGDLPSILRGSFGGDSDALIEGLVDTDPDPDETDLEPLGIDRLGFRVASFDIDDHGYLAPPFVPEPRGEPFPAFSGPGQHIGAAITDANLDVRGLIGPPTPGAAGSRLERLRLSDDICEAPDGVDDYPQYPPAPDDPAPSPYTCAEVDFEAVGGADPLAIGLVLDKGGRHVRVRDAELSDVPTRIQLMLADLPGTAGDDPETPADESVLLDRCPTGGDDSPAAGSCVPPLLRFDAETPGGDPILAAVVEVGDDAALAALDEVPVPVTDLPDLSAPPTPAGWSEWGPDPRGVRVAMAPVPGAGDETALRAGIRIPLPDALTVHPFQSWSDERRSDSAEDPAFWAASDLAFAYEATIDGETIPSLGHVAALIRDADGAHIVATDGAEVTVGHTDGAGGVADRAPNGIPGEFDFALYRRENKLLGRQLIQLDGRVNQTTDLRFRMVPPSTDDGVPLDAQLLNLQPEQSAGQTEPSFRLRVELLTDPETLGDPPPGDPSGCPEFIAGSCSEAEVVVEQATAVFDMAPDPAHVTRLLQAAIRVGDQTGMQVQAFGEIDGDADGGEPDALVSGELGVHLDPLYIEWGGGFVLGAHVEIDAKLSAYVLLDRVSDFSLRQTVARLNVENVHHVDDADGNPAEGPGVILPMLDPEHLEVDVWLDLYFFDVDLFGLTWLESLGEADEPVSVDFEECGVGSQLLGTFVDVLGGSALLVAKSLEALTDGSYNLYERRGLRVDTDDGVVDTIVVPDAFTDPRVAFEVLGFIPIPIVGGMLAELLDFLLCPISGDPDSTLIDPALGFPADTLDIEGHTVPDAAISVALPEGAEQTNDEPLVVEEGDILALCGNHRYPTVDVHGILVVGTTPAEGCPGGSGGELRLSAEDIHVHSEGQVIHASDGSLALVGDFVTIEGHVTSSNGVMTIHGNDTLMITNEGSVTADGASTAVPLGPDGDPLGQLPGGNGGGGHGDNDRGGTIFDSGGDGSDGDGGGSYGDDDSRSTGTEAGSPGSGTARGFGGGAITLFGNTLIIAGPVTANGTDASDRSCDSETTILGGGGGSGGGIVLAAAHLHLASDVVFADGGDGGTSPAGGGGGGGGGVIKVISPQLNGPLPDGPRGGNGGSGCDEGDDGDDGVDIDDVVSDLGPQSQFEPYDGLWVTEDVDPGTPGHELMGRFSGAQPLGGVNDFNVAVCASFLPAEWALDDHDDDGRPDGPPTRSDFAMPHPSTVEEEHPCGEFAILPPGCTVNCQAFIAGELLATTQIENSNEVLFDPDDPDSPGQVLLDEIEDHCFGSTDFDCPEGFWGVWTMIVTTTVDGNDCYDDDDEASDDEDACAAEEQQPVRPDVVFGVDNTDGRVTLATVEESESVVPHLEFDDRWFTTQEEVAFTIEATDLVEDQPAPLSGVARIECVEHGGVPAVSVPFDCHLGRNVHEFRTPGDGWKRIVVAVIDAAGNRSLAADATFPAAVNVIRDITPPIGSPGLFGPHADIDPGVPDGFNGWYRTVPEIRLLTAIDADNSDGTDGVGPPSNEPHEPVWRYRYNEAGELACADVPEERLGSTVHGCRLIDVPALGAFTLHFTPVDRLGNRLLRDTDDPDLLMRHTDELRIDGVAPTSALITVPLDADGDNGWFVTEPFVVLSAVDQPGASGLVHGPDDPDDIAGLYYRLDGAPEVRFTEPFRVTDGEHEVCWRAVDVAGNADVGVPEVEPSLLELRLAGHCKPVRVDTVDPVATLAATPASPDGGAGWYLSPPAIAASATDAAPGSGVAPGALVVSFDGGPFAPFAGPLTIPEGIHDVRAYATDSAGRRSRVVEVDLAVDESAPVASARLVPPDPARDGWWRRLPTLVLRAGDGDQNAGLDRIEWAMDAGSFVTYTGPVEVPAGVHTVRYRAVDHAGRVGPETVVDLPVDTRSPLARATAPSPVVWSRLLGPANARLQWQVGDDRSSEVRVTVLVVDQSGNTIRRLEHGPVAVVPGTPLSGFTNWDGRDVWGNRLLGIFHYRVIVTDEAGHRSESGESRPLQIKLL